MNFLVKTWEILGIFWNSALFGQAYAKWDRNQGPEAPKSRPGGSQIVPGGSKIDPGSAKIGKNQKSPEFLDPRRKMVPKTKKLWMGVESTFPILGSF